MNFSSETITLRKRFGNERAIQILADAGFRYIDFSLDDIGEENSPWNEPNYLEQAKYYRRMADQRNIKFNQTHAPYVFDWSSFETGWRGAVERVIKCFEIAGVLGIDTVIVHPIHYFAYRGNEEKSWEINSQYYSTLLPYARKYGVRIAMENMYTYDPAGRHSEDALSQAKRFASAVDMFHDPHIVACVDVGHVNMLGRKAGDLIRSLGHDRVKALHIHDNDAVKDRHVIPYLGTIDWEDVCKALAEIDYDGVFTFETLLFFDKFEDDFLPCVASWLYDLGVYLTDKVQKYKAAQIP